MGGVNFSGVNLMMVLDVRLWMEWWGKPEIFRGFP